MSTSYVILLNEFDIVSGETIDRLKEKGRDNITVLDLCSGKGGDILKWKKGNVSHVTFTGMIQDLLISSHARFSVILVRL